jgi:class 3 adenylate cyclase
MRDGDFYLNLVEIPAYLRGNPMTADQVECKLAAILSADFKGYGRLMGEDEEWTLRTLDAYKERSNGGLIQQHRGRIVGTAGDNVLAKFSSYGYGTVRCGDTAGAQYEECLTVKDLPDGVSD